VAVGDVEEVSMRLLRVLLVLAVLTISSCTAGEVSGSSSTSPVADPSSTSSTVGSTTSSTGGAVVEFDFTTTEWTEAEGVAFQEALLADGEVTFADYERAVFTSAQCAREAGAPVRGPMTERQAREQEGAYSFAEGQNPDLVLTWWIASPNPEELNAVLADVEACRRNFLEIVERAWQDVSNLSVGAQADWLSHVKECIEEAGIEIPASALYLDVIDIAIEGKALHCM
jgi:hypothetical protein